MLANEINKWINEQIVPSYEIHMPSSKGFSDLAKQKLITEGIDYLEVLLEHETDTVAIESRLALEEVYKTILDVANTEYVQKDPDFHPYIDFSFGDRYLAFSVGVPGVIVGQISDVIDDRVLLIGEGNHNKKRKFVGSPILEMEVSNRTSDLLYFENNEATCSVTLLRYLD